MTLGERILLKYSRPVDAPDCIPAAPDKHNLENALDDLFDAFPSLPTQIQGKAVLDYGCGPGWQTACLARINTGLVAGVDINPNWVEHAQGLIAKFGLSQKARIHAGWNDQLKGQFDIVISKDSFEHYREPEMALTQMKSALRPGGRLFIVFSWPWFSPLGSHMQVFTLIPWVNLLFSEKTIMRVRSRYRHDGAMRYEDVESGLNKMTVRRFQKIIRESGMETESLFLRGFKGWHILTRFPMLRELFTQQVGCILRLTCNA